MMEDFFFLSLLKINTFVLRIGISPWQIWFKFAIEMNVKYYKQ